MKAFCPPQPEQPSGKAEEREAKKRARHAAKEEHKAKKVEKKVEKKEERKKRKSESRHPANEPQPSTSGVVMDVDIDDEEPLVSQAPATPPKETPAVVQQESPGQQQTCLPH